MAPAAGLPDGNNTRVVLFLTSPVDPSLAGAGTTLACLLPWGWTTFVEQVLATCSEAGLREIDLVVSEGPELLRSRLGDGERWGLRLRWHLAKDGHTPYSVLHDMVRARPVRLLVGHGHEWIDAGTLRGLLARDCSVVRMDTQAAWAGWASLSPSQVLAVSRHADAEQLATTVLGLPLRQQLVRAEQGQAAPATVPALLALQTRALRGPYVTKAPARWLRKPWGLMSPDAHVHPQAQITGPVVVGPRCVVGRGATLGEHSVLVSDVMVASGAVVLGSVVMPHTYVSGDLSLMQAVASGATVMHAAWGVEHRLPVGDALLTPLHQAGGGPLAQQGPVHWLSRQFGRGVALSLCVLLAPVCGPLWLARRLAGQATPWSTEQVVDGLDAERGSPRLRDVRWVRPASPLDGGYTLWQLVAGALDVAQNRRHWFGIRPRTPSQWYALPRDWQQLFAERPLGVLFAPAWMDPQAPAQREGQDGAAGEMLAAADAYFAVAGGWREKGRILAGLLLGRARGSQIAAF